MFNQIGNFSALKRTIKESLNWESFEQQSLWTIIEAHRGIKIENWVQGTFYL